MMRVSRQIVLGTAAMLVSGTLAAGALASGARTRVTPSWQNLSQLPPGEGVYEMWFVQGNVWHSCGKFNMDVDAQRMHDLNGAAIDTLETDGDWSASDAIVISLEPSTDPDPASPNEARVLGGDIHGTVVDTLKVSHPLAIGAVFDAARCAGKFHINTPSDDCTNTADWNSGVWFYDPANPVASSLTLPALPSPWEYEFRIGDASSVDQIPSTLGVLDGTGADCDGVGPYQGVTELAPRGTCASPYDQSPCGSASQYAPGFGSDFVAPGLGPTAATRPNLPLFCRAPAGQQDQWSIVMSINPHHRMGPSPFPLAPLQLLQIPPTLGMGVLSSMGDFSATLPRGSAVITLMPATAARTTTWGALKAHYVSPRHVL